MIDNNFNTSGQLDWIGIREKEGDIKGVKSILALQGLGLEGDKITLKSSKKRQVTMMQNEHISVILSLAQENDHEKNGRILLEQNEFSPNGWSQAEVQLFLRLVEDNHIFNPIMNVNIAV